MKGMVSSQMLPESFVGDAVSFRYPGDRDYVLRRGPHGDIAAGAYGKAAIIARMKSGPSRLEKKRVSEYEDAAKRSRTSSPGSLLHRSSPPRAGASSIACTGTRYLRCSGRRCRRESAPGACRASRSA